MSLSDLPTVNALLNVSTAVLLVAGYRFIRRRRINAHRLCMLLALLASVLFLSSYVYYHARVGSVPFRGRGLLRALYFAILVPHTVLAAAIVPLAAVTVTRALRGELPRHVRIARVTLPLWLFVSVTGVMVYLMLYHCR